MFGRLQKTVEIPEDVELQLNGSVVTVKGPLGELTRDFSFSGLIFEKKDGKLVISVFFPKKKEKALLGAIESHVKNMVHGVTKGYKYSMKIVFSHFPIKVIPQGSEVKVENLYGGRKPRFAKILPGVKVEVDGENVYVSGIDKEKVGQTCANIQELTRLRGKRRKSPKTFMDGIFTFDKSGTIA